MKRMVTVLLIPFLIALAACSGSFDIKGKWQSVGTQGWGQAQPGSMVVFSENQVNLYSPWDTYLLYEEGGQRRLKVTGVIGGGETFRVVLVDSNNIELYQGSDSQPAVKLKRVD